MYRNMSTDGKKCPSFMDTFTANAICSTLGTAWSCHCICIKAESRTGPVPEASRARCELLVGLWCCTLVHLCIAVEPADKPACKPRDARTRFNAAASGDDTVFEVTAAIYEGTVQKRTWTWSFSSENWVSEEPAAKNA